MDYLKRGFTSIIRKPGKTLILAGIIFILGNIIAGAVSVQQAVKNTESVLRTKMSPAVTLNLNEEKLEALLEQNSEFSLENLSVEAIEKIGALSYVKHFDYSIGTTLESRDLNRSGRDVFGAAAFPPFRFQGVNDPDLIDLKEGKIKLVSGRVFDEQEIKNLSHVALISQSLANINNIFVGSRLGFEMNIIQYDADGNLNIIATRKYEFEVVGIFEPVKQVRRSSGRNVDYFSFMDDEMENKIYAPNRALYEVSKFQLNEYEKLEGIAHIELTEYAPLYILKDPLDRDKFVGDAAALAPEYYTFSNAVEDFDKIAAPLGSLQDIAAIVLYIAVVATVIILSLLITLFLRDRRHEIGVYLAIGERKAKIAAQIGFEVIVVAVIAITLSLFSGSVLSEAVSEKMLIDQIAAERSQDDTFSWSKVEMDIRGYQTEISSDDIIRSYSASPDLSAVFLFYAIGIGTICVSVLIPIIYMIRLTPRRILM